MERALDVRPTAATIGGKTSLRDRIRAVENILIGGINNFGDRHVFGAPRNQLLKRLHRQNLTFQMVQPCRIWVPWLSQY